MASPKASSPNEGKTSQVKSGGRSRGAKAQIRFEYPEKITSIKHRLVFDAFQTIFEQFPQKIAELKALQSEQKNLASEDMLTDLRCFSIPPPLRAIQAEQDKAEQAEKAAKSKEGKSVPMSCNCNRQVQIYLTYDGYIRTNSHLVQFVSKLEAYYDFFGNWWSKFYYALMLLKPQMQEENNLQSNIQDSTIAFLSDICYRINKCIDSVNVCEDRFNNILRVQRYPHVNDNRQNLAMAERETWFELCLVLQQLHSNFVLTYDCVVKNYHKLISI